MEFRAGANVFAYLVLAAFVPFSVFVFGRSRPAPAAAGLALAGCLFLPEVAAVNLELMPPLEKNSLTYLAILLGALVHRGRELALARPGRGPEALLIAIFLANLATVVTNQDAVPGAMSVTPAVTPYALISHSALDVLRYVLPFFLGRCLFRSERDLRDLMGLLVASGLLYSLFILAEMGLSSIFRVFQFGAWVYGAFTSIPVWRWGGLQPVVFMSNPLAVAVFVATSAVAAAGLARARLRVLRIPAGLACLALLVIVALCRNVAAVAYAGSMVCVQRLLPPRRSAAVALAIAIFVGVYPLLRLGELFPYRELVAFAEGFDRERARSLGGRFDEEDEFLRRSSEKLWFGWGDYERIPVSVEAGTGSKSIDGFWILVAGVHGVAGLELRFALLLWPVFVAWRCRPRVESRADQALLAALMGIVAFRGVDLLPNGWWTNLPIFLAGALHGLARGLAPARATPRHRARERRRSAAIPRRPRATVPAVPGSGTGAIR